MALTKAKKGSASKVSGLSVVGSSSKRSTPAKTSSPTPAKTVTQSVQQTVQQAVQKVTAPVAKSESQIRAESNAALNKTLQQSNSKFTIIGGKAVAKDAVDAANIAVTTPRILASPKTIDDPTKIDAEARNVAAKVFQGETDVTAKLAQAVVNERNRLLGQGLTMAEAQKEATRIGITKAEMSAINSSLQKDTIIQKAAQIGTAEKLIKAQTSGELKPNELDNLSALIKNPDIQKSFGANTFVNNINVQLDEKGIDTNPRRTKLQLENALAAGSTLKDLRVNIQKADGTSETVSPALSALFDNNKATKPIETDSAGNTFVSLSGILKSVNPIVARNALIGFQVQPEKLERDLQNRNEKFLKGGQVGEKSVDDYRELFIGQGTKKSLGQIVPYLDNFVNIKTPFEITTSPNTTDGSLLYTIKDSSGNKIFNSTNFAEIFAFLLSKGFLDVKPTSEAKPFQLDKVIGFLQNEGQALAYRDELLGLFESLRPALIGVKGGNKQDDADGKKQKSQTKTDAAKTSTDVFPNISTAIQNFIQVIIQYIQSLFGVSQKSDSQNSENGVEN